MSVMRTDPGLLSQVMQDLGFFVAGHGGTVLDVKFHASGDSITGQVLWLWPHTSSAEYVVQQFFQLGEFAAFNGAYFPLMFYGGGTGAYDAAYAEFNRRS